MKKYLWIGLAVLALAACKNDKKKGTPAPVATPQPAAEEIPVITEVDTCEVFGEVSFEDKMASMELDVRVDYIKNGRDPVVIKKINDFILQATFGEDYEGMSFDEAKETLYNACFSNAEEELEDVNELTLYGNLMPQWENYINYSVVRYEYAGGAHGMNSTMYYVFDGDTGEPVSVIDLFEPGYEETLAKALTDEVMLLADDDGLELFEEYLESGVRPNGNFYLSDEGLVFLYNPYEIAPYAMGEIEVLVPWEKMSDYVK